MVSNEEQGGRAMNEQDWGSGTEKAELDSSSGCRCPRHPLGVAGKLSFDDICFGIALALSRLLAGSAASNSKRDTTSSRTSRWACSSPESRTLDEALSLLRRLGQ
jgi:hypothetical protein